MLIEPPAEGSHLLLLHLLFSLCHINYEDNSDPPRLVLILRLQGLLVSRMGSDDVALPVKHMQEAEPLQNLLCHIAVSQLGQVWSRPVLSSCSMCWSVAQTFRLFILIFDHQLESCLM